MDDAHKGLKQFKHPQKGMKICKIRGATQWNFAARATHIFCTIVNTTPLLKDLYQHITPQYAADWEVIGTLLGLPSGTLDIIEHDHMHKATRCCNAMLRKWLEMDTTASWRKLFTVIESPAVSCSPPDKGD